MFFEGHHADLVSKFPFGLEKSLRETCLPCNMDGPSVVDRIREGRMPFASSREILTLAGDLKYKGYHFV